MLHIGVKLPDIAYGLKAKATEADVLTEIPWNENPYSHSNAGDGSRAALAWHFPAGLLAAAGAGIGVVESRVLVQSFEQDWGLNHFKRPAGFIWGISGAHVRRGRQTLLMPKPPHATSRNCSHARNLRDTLATQRAEGCWLPGHAVGRPRRGAG